MASTAISAQGTSLKLGSSGSAKNITAATKANPVKLTSTAHGLAEGSVVVLAAIGGMTQLNAKVGVVKVVDANSFELPGINSTDYTSYTSGGTATPTQVTVGNLLDYDRQGGQSADIDVTNLASEAKESIPGLQDNGQITGNLHIDDADQGQQALLSSRAGGIKVAHVLTLRNGKTRSFSAACTQFTEQGGVDAAVRGSFTCRISGAVVFG